MPGWGTIAVTPVRIGPVPTSRGPSPSISVVIPTVTPPTSVIAFSGPGGSRPDAESQVAVAGHRANRVQGTLATGGCRRGDRHDTASGGARARWRRRGRHPERAGVDDEGASAPNVLIATNAARSAGREQADHAADAPGQRPPAHAAAARHLDSDRRHTDEDHGHHASLIRRRHPKRARETGGDDRQAGGKERGEREGDRRAERPPPGPRAGAPRLGSRRARNSAGNAASRPSGAGSGRSPNSTPSAVPPTHAGKSTNPAPTLNLRVVRPSPAAAGGPTSRRRRAERGGTGRRRPGQPGRDLTPIGTYRALSMAPTMAARHAAAWRQDRRGRELGGSGERRDRHHDRGDRPMPAARARTPNDTPKPATATASGATCWQWAKLREPPGRPRSGIVSAATRRLSAHARQLRARRPAAQVVRRALAGLPDARGYRLRVAPLRYRTVRISRPGRTSTERQITLQVPQPFFPFGEIVPYAAAAGRGEGEPAFIWLTEGVTFRTHRGGAPLPVSARVDALVPEGGAWHRIRGRNGVRQVRPSQLPTPDGVRRRCGRGARGAGDDRGTEQVASRCREHNG